MQIRKSRTYACRCRRCGHRKRLKHHPDDLVVRVKSTTGRPEYRKRLCESCSKASYRVDKYRDDGREARGKTCRCGNYSFPHVRGRGYCDHNPRLTDAMMQQRYEERAFA